MELLGIKMESRLRYIYDVRTHQLNQLTVACYVHLSASVRCTRAVDYWRQSAPFQKEIIYLLRSITPRADTCVNSQITNRMIRVVNAVSVRQSRLPTFLFQKNNMTSSCCMCVHDSVLKDLIFFYLDMKALPLETNPKPYSLITYKKQQQHESRANL